MMDFWNYLEKLSTSEKFPEEKVQLGLRKSTYMPNFRAHTSLSSIMDLSKEIKQGEAFLEKESKSLRYVFAYNLTYDLLLSLYEVSTFKGIFARIAMPLSKAESNHLQKILDKINEKNVEVRLIGLQNKQSNYKELLQPIFKMARRKGELIEADLFGNEARHIAIDLKTGLSYDVLLENRIYRPGELINTQSFDDFSKSALRLKLK